MKLEPCVDCEFWDEAEQRCAKENQLPEHTNCIRVKALEEYLKTHSVSLLRS